MFSRYQLTLTTESRAVRDHQHRTDAELLAEAQTEEANNLNKLQYKSEYSLVNYYVLLGDLCLEITTGRCENYFNSIMIGAILLAGVNVGLQTYPSLANNSILADIDILILVLFSFEVVLKVIGEKLMPWRFFTGPEGNWNSFDFFVIIMCMPFFATLFKGGSAAIRIASRLFRLARISKIVKRIPALQVIVTGLVGGMKSILYIAILLLLVFYLYGIIGVYLFSANDPFFFRTVPVAILTLFHGATLDNWGQNMYINAYGCEAYANGLYVTREAVGDTVWFSTPVMYRCDTPTKQPVFSAVYWVTFIVISALIMLQLFVGVITMSMQESLDDMRKEVEESNRKIKLLKQKKEMEELMSRSKAANAASVLQKLAKKPLTGFKMGGSNVVVPHSFPQSNPQPCDSLQSQSGSSKNHQNANNFSGGAAVSAELSVGTTSVIAPGVAKVKDFLRKGMLRASAEATKLNAYSLKERKQFKELEEMKALLMQAWSGSMIAENHQLHLDEEQGHSITKYLRWNAQLAQTILANKYFNAIMLLVVIGASVLVGVEADYVSDTSSPAILSLCSYLENIIFVIFALEVYIRMSAEEFSMYEYFRHSWNCFDFLIVLLAKMPGGGTVVMVLRMVRLLRVLKVVKSFPGLAVIVNALLMGLSSIGYVGIIMGLNFYMFAILGLILFHENDKFNFGTLHGALFTLLDVATLDNWGGIMYTQVYGCDVYPPPALGDPFAAKFCTTPHKTHMFAVAYFVVFVVIGALVMLTLFIGVITTSMEEASKQQLVELDLEKRVSELCKTKTISHDHLQIMRRVFAKLDLDGSGTIETAELKVGLSAINIYPSDAQLIDWMRDVDANYDGGVDLIEFVTFMTQTQKRMELQEKNIRAQTKAKKKKKDAAVTRAKDAFRRVLNRSRAAKVGVEPAHTLVTSIEMPPTSYRDDCDNNIDSPHQTPLSTSGSPSRSNSVKRIDSFGTKLLRRSQKIIGAVASSVATDLRASIKLVLADHSPVGARSRSSSVGESMREAAVDMAVVQPSFSPNVSHGSSRRIELDRQTTPLSHSSNPNSRSRASSLTIPEAHDGEQKGINDRKMTVNELSAALRQSAFPTQEINRRILDVNVELQKLIESDSECQPKTSRAAVSTPSSSMETICLDQHPCSDQPSSSQPQVLFSEEKLLPPPDSLQESLSPKLLRQYSAAKSSLTEEEHKQAYEGNEVTVTVPGLDLDTCSAQSFEDNKQELDAPGDLGSDCGSVGGDSECRRQTRSIFMNKTSIKGPRILPS